MWPGMVVLLIGITRLLRQVNGAPGVGWPERCMRLPGALAFLPWCARFRTQRASGRAPATAVFAAAGRLVLRSLSRAT